MKKVIYNVYKLVMDKPSMLIFQSEVKEAVFNYLGIFEFNDAVNKNFKKIRLTKAEKNALIEEFYKLYDMTLTKIIHISYRVNSKDLQTIEALIVVTKDKIWKGKSPITRGFIFFIYSRDPEHTKITSYEKITRSCNQLWKTARSTSYEKQPDQPAITK